MATFHIHQDAEKENTTQAQAAKLRNLPICKDKRATFAVLNNVTHVPRVQQGKTAFHGKKSNQTTKANVENIFNNVGNGRVIQQKKVTGVPLEQFRTFSVYEDENRAPESTKCEVEVKPGELNVSSGSVRDPLYEIKTNDVRGETPMSVVRREGKAATCWDCSYVFIAAKYEEIDPPDVNEFVFITDDTYTKAQVLRMEQCYMIYLT